MPPGAAPFLPEPSWITDAADKHGWTWARTQWQRAASQPGAWFDQYKADAVIERWPKWFRLTNDRFYDTPFVLNDWQAIIVRMLVGWKIPEEVIDGQTKQKKTVYVRLYRQLRLWIARKGGKTEFLAALGLLFFVFEKVRGGEGYVFAKDENQARVLFKKMQVMVNLNPAISKDAQLYRKSIFIPGIDGSIELLAGTAEGKHGKGPTVVLGDEMHEWANTDLADTLRQGMGARLQPIELYASTAGLRTNPTGFGLWEESEAILEGRIDLPSTLIVSFAADPDDDPFDESIWHKANPSLGLTPTWRFLRGEAAKAKNNPRAEAHFRCYHLNQWVDSETRWIPAQIWKACTTDPAAWLYWPRDLAGKRCVGAVDVSSSKDLTALVLRFDPDADCPVPRLLCRFWIPETTLAQRAAQYPAWHDWVRKGAVELMPGNVIDQSVVMKACLDARDRYDLRLLGRDPWNTDKLWTDLQTLGWDPATLVDMRQGIVTLGEPSKHFEARVFGGQIDHGGQPVLEWMAANTVVRFDENLNFMPARKRSRDKIDGIVAAVMCEGLAQVDTASVYEERGILTV